MADSQTKQKGGGFDHKEKHDLYLTLLLILIFLAFLSLLLVPRGSQFQRCSTTPIEQNKITCLKELAQSTENSSICKYLPSQNADQCYESIAMNTTNVTACTKIKSASLSNACIDSVAIATNSSKSCYLSYGSYRSICLFNVALRTNNASLCSATGNATEITYCNSIVYYNKAIASENIAYCGNIQSNSDTNVTRNLFQNQASNKVSIESNFSGLLYYADITNVTLGARDFCYLSIAYELRNTAYCSRVSNQYIQSLCLSVSNYAYSNSTVNYTAIIKQCNVANPNLSICNSTILIYEAIHDKNATICSRLGANYSSQCYSSLAQTYDNASYCSYIKNSTQNNACVYSTYNITANSTGR